MVVRTWLATYGNGVMIGSMRMNIRTGQVRARKIRRVLSMAVLVCCAAARSAVVIGLPAVRTASGSARSSSSISAGFGFVFPPSLNLSSETLHSESLTRCEKVLGGL
jgi:hypothetical protein